MLNKISSFFRTNFPKTMESMEVAGSMILNKIDNMVQALRPVVNSVVTEVQAFGAKVVVATVQAWTVVKPYGERLCVLATAVGVPAMAIRSFIKWVILRGVPAITVRVILVKSITLFCTLFCVAMASFCVGVAVVGYMIDGWNGVVSIFGGDIGTKFLLDIAQTIGVYLGTLVFTTAGLVLLGAALDREMLVDLVSNHTKLGWYNELMDDGQVVSFAPILT